MPISNSCIELVKQYEGFRERPYLCAAGVATIGYGTTFYPDGRAVQLSDAPISKAQANMLLQNTLNKIAAQLEAMLPKNRLTQGQINALTSFAYNVGVGGLTKSTMWFLIQTGDMAGAAQQFDKWVFAKGRALIGLIARRSAEKALFMQPR